MGYPYEQGDPVMTEETMREVTIPQQIPKIVQFIHITAGLLEVVAQIFLIAVVLRNNKLKTQSKVSVLNLTAVGILYYSISITFAFLETFVTLRWIYEALLFCLEGAMLLLYITFATLMALDWFLTKFKPKVEEKYRKYQKHVYYFIYLTGMLTFAISMFFSKTHLSFVLILLNAIYAILLLLLITLNVLKRKLKPTNENSSTFFVISNIIMFSLLPCLIANLLMMYIFQVPFVLFCFILYVSWLAHPIFILCTLGASYKDFRETYKAILRRREKESEDGDDVIRNDGNNRQSESVV